ncbi:hypothetical protein LUZ63_023603 [Rhynchospora breviuscula]|uniref:tRNA (guanine-N(1)-)-methyltransferase n=1 Tax=Rhynchospora breviuscula TaxID=2022672 RepID=A0A9P9Z2N0_9POAL|nr:hypothetical protein LUZ63_023603 [Rhynchospora breviuscula]
MVMKPEPWGEALDDVTRDAPVEPVIVFPSPAGERFTQKIARELSVEQHLVVRLRTLRGDRRARLRLRRRPRARPAPEPRRLRAQRRRGRRHGDGRGHRALIPGVVGNPESLVEESHEDGLLEYPSFTKPASWRGREVPPVLLSGNHAAVAAWRREQQFERHARSPPRPARRLIARRQRADAAPPGRGIRNHRRRSTRFGQSTPRYERSVSTIGPSSVIATVCSEWAPREPSALRSVQPSGSVMSSSVVWRNHGSRASTSPARSG